MYYGISTAGDPSISLGTLVANNTKLFVSSYRANQYQNGLNETLEGLIPAGLYQADSEADIYYKRNYRRMDHNKWRCKMVLS